MNNFVHFRIQSSYSMLQSALKIDQIVELAQKNQMSAICLADRENLFASLEFSLESAKAGIQPIHGALLNIKYQSDQGEAFAEILLIAKDPQGYANLLELVSLTFTKNDRSVSNHISFDDLKQYQQGLIVGSAYVDGIIGQLLLSDQVLLAKKYASELKKIFGDRFYFEIMRHGYENEAKIEKAYLDLARDIGVALLATNKILFDDINKHEAHDVLLCISHGVVQEEQNRKRVSNQCYFKSADEMIELFSDLPEAIANTVNLAQRCYVRACSYSPKLPNFTDNSAVSEETLLRQKAKEGLDQHLTQKKEFQSADSSEQKEQYYDRLNYELDIICTMQFAGYFLIVADFINWSKKNDIAVGPGRGSGAGSIIAWAMGITDLDPIEFGLLFERFLNPERVSMPDFDIDFCQERREEVISYVRTKYGDDRVAQIITFGKMQAKAVIKDVSRVLGLKYSFADYLTELVPFNAVSPVSLKQAIEDIAELKQAYQGNGLYNLDGEEKLIKRVLETSLVLEGLHRHSSTHAAGILIANQRLTEIIPVYKDIGGDMLISQYSMKYAELSGLVKFDFLGLQTLTVITKTLSLIKDRGIDLDINLIPLKDKASFAMLSSGLSTGVFQFESIGMKNALRKLRPDSLNDLIALGALYRPGPMDNIPTYIECKHGIKEVDYLHPVLAPILESTYGVIIYQEQVMEIARKLAGYSLGAADLLRRAMGKKVKSEMDAQREKFISGSLKNGVESSQASSIFDIVAKFAGYGFNKSHASAYAVISYRTAYLKANYPLEFFTAYLNLELDNSDKINIFLQDAKDFAINIAPPDINSSGAYFRPSYEAEEKTIIFAIGAIKNVTVNFGKKIEEIRKIHGPFKSIIDFANKIPAQFINRRLLENLIKSGCFDKLHPNRNQLLQSSNKILAYIQSYHSEQQSNQFSLISVETNSTNIIDDAPVLTEEELAQLEFEVFGLYINNHPLSHLHSHFANLSIYDSHYVKKQLEDGGQKVKLCGVIIKKDSRMSQRGRFITLLLSDPCGNFEITIFDEQILRDYAHLINVKDAVIIYADIYKEKGGVRITANKFVSIEEEMSNVTQNLQLNIKNKTDLKNILSMISNSQQDSSYKANISLTWEFEKNFLVKVKLPRTIKITPEDAKILETKYASLPQ